MRPLCSGSYTSGEGLEAAGGAPGALQPEITASKYSTADCWRFAQHTAHEQGPGPRTPICPFPIFPFQC